MEIFYKDSFEKAYKRRYKGNKKMEEAIKKRIALFFYPTENTHFLKLMRLKELGRDFFHFQ